MKHLLFISALGMILFSCKKEISQNPNSISLLTNIRYQLKDSISTNDFQQLDFNNTLITNYSDNNLSFLRIPFTNKSIATDFLLLKIEKNEFFSRGKIINIYKDQTDRSPRTFLQFNGNINIFSLDRNHITHSIITNGYIKCSSRRAMRVSRSSYVRDRLWGHLPQADLVIHIDVLDDESRRVSLSAQTAVHHRGGQGSGLTSRMIKKARSGQRGRGLRAGRLP